MQRLLKNKKSSLPFVLLHVSVHRRKVCFHRMLFMAPVVHPTKGTMQPVRDTQYAAAMARRRAAGEILITVAPSPRPLAGHAAITGTPPFADWGALPVEPTGGQVGTQPSRAGRAVPAHR